MMNPTGRAQREPQPAAQGIGLWKPSLALKFAAFSVFVCLLATGLCIVDLMHARNVAVGVARRAAENVARSLAAQTSDTFDAADGVLHRLARRIEHKGLGTAEQAGLHETMAALIATIPRINGLVVADERGRVVVSEAGDSGVPIASVAGRSDFRYFRSHPSTGVYISEPSGKATGADPALVVARRIDRADGSFGGVALASIDVRSFENVFDGVDVGASGTIALVADDGMLVAQRPRAAADAAAVRIADDAAAHTYASFAAASYVGTSPADGVRRLFAFDRLARYPLRIVVGLAESEYLAAWRADAVANYAALAFGTALIGALASGLGAQIARRKRAENALALLPVDVLTGLASRGRFDAELTREWRRGAGDRMPLGLLLIDIANLKAYNDRYGREEGDELLISVARALASLISPSDLAARYSGLELAVILPATDDTAARLAAERYRTAIMELVARLTRTRGAMVTVSVGAASMVPSISAEPAMLVGAAFVALHGAKNETHVDVAAGVPDALTGIANRRRFDAELDREWRRAAAERAPLALLLLEVDNLKAYNDRYGREEGDELLISVARTVSTLVAPTQLAARYSGLEFAVLLPATDEVAALQIAERIALAVRALFARQPGLSAAMVTVAVGTASRTPEHPDDAAILVGAAFTALSDRKSADGDFAAGGSNGIRQR